MIVQGRGKTHGDILCNGGKYSREIQLEAADDSRCSCSRYPELVEVMQMKHPDVWQKCGHVHMPAADVPWDERDICAVNMKSEVTGTSNLGLQEADRMLKNILKQTLRGGQEEMQEMESLMMAQQVEVKPFQKKVDRAFLECRAHSLNKKMRRGAGLVADVWDRDLGRLGLTCPYLHDQFARENFEYAKTKEEWEQWDEDLQGEKPGYWRVPGDPKELLTKTKEEYERRNVERCGDRWVKWNDKGGMIDVKHIYKRKDIMKVRKIFNARKDAVRAEMGIQAKVINLISHTLGTVDFSMDSCQELSVFLQATEARLADVYGAYTRFLVDGTDFKCFFPSNTKDSVIEALRQAMEMITGGAVRAGCRMPRGEWVSVQVTTKGNALMGGKAVWGHYKQDGWTCRKVGDVDQFLKFRSEVAGAFIVGDTVLESEEVTIGEPYNPSLCDIAAKLSEHKFMLSLTEQEAAVFDSKRYCDDGCDVGVYSSQDTETREMLQAVIEKHHEAYPGITVTREGGADEAGGVLEMLEYKVGVGEAGRCLTWHFNNKNSEQVLNGEGQRLLKLRHWRSGTYSKKLLEIVKSRLVDMATMTKEVVGHCATNRGAGDVTRDLKFTVWELLTELHCCLAYPMRPLLNCLKRMAHTSSLWAAVMEGAMQIKEML